MPAENTDDARTRSIPTELRADWQTPVRGANADEYRIYLDCADDGRGGDLTRNGEPLLTFDEWLAA